MTTSVPSSLVFLFAILVALTQNHFSNGKFFGGGGRRRGNRPGSFLGGNIFLPRENITLTNLTCAADAPPPVTCGRKGNATGILACRTRTRRRRQGGPLGFFGGGGFTTVTTNTTRCVDPARARESDTCGCCLDEMDRCPTAPCGCPCNIMDRNGNVIGTGVNVTFVGRRRRRGGRFGGGVRGRRRSRSRCVSLEDSVTLQLFRGMECVATDVCETSTTDVVDSP